MTGPVDAGDGGRPIVRQCTAHVPSGRRCRRSALRGASVCWVHGGAAGQVRRAAERRVAEAGAVAAFERFSPGGDRSVNVIAELMRLVARVTAFADFAAARIEALTAEQWAVFSPRTAAEVDLFRQVLRDTGRVLIETARLGLDERALEQDARFSEALGAKLAKAVEGVLEDLGHHDPRHDPAVAAVVTARFDRLLAAGDDGGTT
jgi:hypothetical protein